MQLHNNLSFGYIKIKHVDYLPSVPEEAGYADVKYVGSGGDKTFYFEGKSKEAERIAIKEMALQMSDEPRWNNKKVTAEYTDEFTDEFTPLKKYKLSRKNLATV
jgi:hypothetical protein